MCESLAAGVVQQTQSSLERDVLVKRCRESEEELKHMEVGIRGQLICYMYIYQCWVCMHATWLCILAECVQRSEEQGE